MSNIGMKPIGAPQELDPRRTFEAALAQIRHNNGEPRLSKTSIAVRKQTAMPGAQAAEKQALTDAARALARLWKVSPALARRGG
jgi:hypothetical protein